MKSSILAPLCLLIAITFCQQYQAVFAVSWLSGFCEYDGDCSHDAVARWDHQSFTIHGLWPQTSTKKFFGQLNPSTLDSELIKDMFNCWPPQTKNRDPEYFLWKYEWKKHGKDYSTILLDLDPQTFSTLQDERNIQLQTRYFKDTINLYKNLKLQKIPKASFSLDEFAYYLGISRMTFYPICNKDTGTLQELRICVMISKYGVTFTTCSKMPSLNCKINNQIILGSWQQSARETPVEAEQEAEQEALGDVAAILIISVIVFALIIVAYFMNARFLKKQKIQSSEFKEEMGTQLSSQK